MALTTDTFWIWKWIAIDWSTLFTIYGKMFDPNVPDAPSSYSRVSLVDESYSYNLSWFQPWLEVCVCCLEVGNETSSTISWSIQCTLQQWTWWDWEDGDTIYFWYFDIEPTRWYFNYMWVWIDPDEIRPWISQYRFHWVACWQDFYKTFTVSNLSFDDVEHPAWYLWVEWNNLCYVPPSIYSGSSDTGYKHIIEYDEWYSGWSWEPWYIWIPSSSSDHHIYYVTEYGTVYRTKESYAWSWWSSSAGSNKSWYIRMTPSTSWTPEQAWYNYLCYVDGWWYKRRMGVWEV